MEVAGNHFCESDIKTGDHAMENDAEGTKHILEELAVIAYIFVAYISHLFLTPLMIYWCFTSTAGCFFAASYMAWFFYDHNIHENCGRQSRLFRNLSWWRYLRRYFPVTVHKTAELAPEGTYLLAVMPHGVLALSAFSVFGTNAHELDIVFPNITFYLLTLKLLFYLPITRELCNMSGMVSSTARSLDRVLNKSGRAAVVVVGGAAEANYSQPGQYKLMLKKRKGFCRAAINTGASLVPVVCFGEVDIYDVSQPKPGSLLDSIQQWIKSTTGVMAVMMQGTGWFGIIPKRKPINVVVGAAIKVEKKSISTEEDVNDLHEKFMASTIQLFEQHKRYYLTNTDTQLQFI